jgi:murein DD-endopeptidase MepM/ murein hydrolase activator NlpD
VLKFLSDATGIAFIPFNRKSISSEEDAGPMGARRYTVVIADRTSGVVRRVTISLRPALALVAGVMMLPVLVGLGARWSATSEIEELKLVKSALEIENGSYRAATGELTGQIQSLESVITDLGARAQLDPAQARAMQKLPAMVKARAAGGTLERNAAVSEIVKLPLSSPEDTFGVLRDLLNGLESRLRFVRRDVEQREALASATPSIWPTHGWLTGTFGGRSDPFSGESAFHQGLDISTDKGQPVIATADGTIESAAYNGDYGNLIVISHGFGLTTRYGHLSAFAVKAGQTVRRGDVIGYVGATGRATGSHLHYEILANGRLINPLQLLTQPVAH